MHLPKIHFGFKRHLPMLLQTEAAECGLACLGMIASWHGYQTSLDELRRQFSLSLKGLNLAQLLKIAQDLHLQARPLRVELEYLEQMPTPAILHWDFNHFVVLAKVERRYVTLHDPAIGIRKVSWEELSQHFTGIAVELSPLADFQPKPAPPAVSLRQLIGPIHGLKRALSQILIVALALEACSLLSPMYNQLVVDDAVVTGDHDLLTVLGLGFLLLLVVQAGLSAARSWAVLYLSTHLKLQWQSNVFTHLLRLPIVFFEKRHLGDILSRFNSITTIQYTLTSQFVEALLDGLLAITTGIMIFVYSPLLAGLTLLAMAIYIAIRFIIYQPLYRANESYLISSAQQQTALMETVRGVQSIKLFNREQPRLIKWLNLTVDATNQLVKSQQIELGYTTLQTLLKGLERIVIIWLSALFVLDQKFTVGMLFAFLSYQDQFSTRVIGLIDKFLQFRLLRLHLERLADLVLAESERKDGLNHLPVGPIGLTVNNLAFRYADGEPWVLRDVNFTVQPGESVAIIGASGCGKTTLLKILLGLLDPQQGKVCANETELQKLSPYAWREVIGTVMQDDQLFAGSIADNIACFDPQPDQSLVEEAAFLASIHEDIQAMPMRYHTLIGDMGTALSGGQKQRILLARALYKKPQILFLDEATSHLDIHSEQRVNTAIRGLAITRVLIAHRPETIRSADRVIRIENGVAIDLGKPTEAIFADTTAA